jgi:hypothetical protein
MINNQYHYATMRVADIVPLLQLPVPDDSYTSEDHTTSTLRNLLHQGYRWIRTDGDHAVFEKLILEGIPANRD